MYALFRSLIDDLLMSPTLAPFIVSALVIVIVFSVISVITGGNGNEEDESA